MFNTPSHQRRLKQKQPTLFVFGEILAESCPCFQTENQGSVSSNPIPGGPSPSNVAVQCRLAWGFPRWGFLERFSEDDCHRAVQNWGFLADKSLNIAPLWTLHSIQTDPPYGPEGSFSNRNGGH